MSDSSKQQYTALFFPRRPLLTAYRDIRLMGYTSTCECKGVRGYATAHHTGPFFELFAHRGCLAVRSIEKNKRRRLNDLSKGVRLAHDETITDGTCLISALSIYRFLIGRLPLFYYRQCEYSFDLLKSRNYNWMFLHCSCSTEFQQISRIVHVCKRHTLVKVVTHADVDRCGYDARVRLYVCLSTA